MNSEGGGCMSMDAEDIKMRITEGYGGVVCKQAYGETTFFYNPGNVLKNGVYFCTIKENDGPNDKSSRLCREGVYRISTGITKSKYVELFGAVPSRPEKGGVIEYDSDFSLCDVILPHPIYGWMSWVSLNSPSESVFEEFLKLIDISYEKAVNKFRKRTGYQK